MPIDIDSMGTWKTTEEVLRIYFWTEYAQEGQKGVLRITPGWVMASHSVPILRKRIAKDRRVEVEKRISRVGRLLAL